MGSSLLASAVAAALSCATRNAAAGGFDVPDLGAQALGRGAAFVARADDGTAIYYNPAGLARQRGTRLYGGANLSLHSFDFQRSGAFPDDPNEAATPWGESPYPVVSNSSGPYLTPLAAVSTDFATFDRLTVAVGVFSPPMIGNRTFPVAIGNAPAASRYDFVQSRTRITFPTGSVAYRVTPWLDLGASAHLVLAQLDHTSVTYADLGQCKNVEYQPCDSRATVQASATSFASTIGVLARPSANVAFGIVVRTPITLDATGVMTPQVPKTPEPQVGAGAATLSTRLPLIARVGARYIGMEGDFEAYDLELDATYERWSQAQGDGPRLRVPSLGGLKDIDTLIVHGYSDTYGVRAGGAYNFETLDGVLSLRAGAFFDSPATSFTYTRIDYDTLAKIAGTFGLGYRHGAVGVDFGYAAIASVPRLVGTNQGDVRPIDVAQGGKPVSNSGDLLPAVNEGAYRGFTHIVSLGVTVTFDELFGAPRPFHFGNAYERGYVAPGEEKVEPSDGGAKGESADKSDTSDKGDKGDKADRPDRPSEDGGKKDADKPPPKKDVDRPPPKREVETPPPPKREVVEKPPEKKPEKKPDKPLEKKKEWWEELD